MCFDLYQDVDSNWKHEITPENGKTNELHKCVLHLSQKLDLRSSNKHVTYQISSFYCT